MVDERDMIEFETPYVLAEAFPHRIGASEDQRRCSACASETQALPASALTVIKHRHARHPSGHLRLYCHEHLVETKESSESADDGNGKTGKTGPVCQDCFVTVPFGTGVCDYCGETVAR